jgi:hypothetical protein
MWFHSGSALSLEDCIHYIDNRLKPARARPAYLGERTASRPFAGSTKQKHVFSALAGAKNTL